MARVSVAMAAYNGRTYLPAQLDSILCQLGSGDEVVISDDGSDDGSVELLRAYRSRDPRIRLLHGPGRGIIPNIAHAIAHTQGNFIFLADQDDVWMPGKVSRLLHVFQERRCHVIVHDCMVVGADLQQVIYPSFFAYRGSGGGVLYNIWKNHYIGCCMAFHKTLKPYILPIPEDIQMHDQWIGVLNDKHRGGTVFLHEPLLYYRRHGGNASDFQKNRWPAMLRNRLVFTRRLAGR